jgi:thymidylate synthase
LEQTKEQLLRTPKTLPRLRLNPNVTNLFDFNFEDIEIVEYDPYPAIKAEVSI